MRKRRTRKGTLGSHTGAAIIAACSVAASTASAATNATRTSELSPANWPVADRTRIEQMERSPWPAAARVVEGRNGLVVGTLSPVAVHAGVQALRSGGTAADAALTTAVTQVATNLGSVVSYAGVLQLVYFDAKSKQVYSLDAGWGSYREETDPASIPATSVAFVIPDRTGAEGTPGRKTLVPGFMAGIETAHKRFGKLPFGELFAPAIWYSANGLEVSPLLGAYFSMKQATLARTPSGQAFLRQAGNELPKVGDRFVQPKVAALLESVAAHGAQVMYAGDWAREFVEVVRAAGGKATAEDLRRYSAVWRSPLQTTFGQFSVMGPDETNRSGCSTLEMLNLLNELKIQERGPYWKDVNAFATILETQQIATFSHYDPRMKEFEKQHGIESKCSARITQPYARAVASAIDTLSGYGTQATEGHHSASVVAVDRWGNVAALIHSINAEIWGDTGLVAGGVPLSSAAGIYQTQLAAIKPGAHVPSDMPPMIVMRNGKPAIAVAGVGSSIVPETVRAIISATRSDVDLPTVVAAPPLLMNFETPSNPLAPRAAVVPRGAYDPAFIEQLRGLSIPVKEEPVERVMAIRGTSSIGQIDEKSGIARSAEAPGVLVFSEGY